MALKQTRRSVSLNRQVYERAAAAAENEGESLSKFTEAALAAWIKSRQRAKALRTEMPSERAPTKEQKRELEEMELAAFPDLAIEYDEAP